MRCQKEGDKEKEAQKEGREVRPSKPELFAHIKVSCQMARDGKYLTLNVTQIFAMVTRERYF